jgi:hypothetical protein
MSEIKFNSKLEAVEDLVGCDHLFMSPEYVRAINKVFGLAENAGIYKAQDTRSEFKGLTVSGANEGDIVEGEDADAIAARLCHALDVKYSPMNGRGSRLRECCRALEEHLKK